MVVDYTYKSWAATEAPNELVLYMHTQNIKNRTEHLFLQFRDNKAYINIFLNLIFKTEHAFSDKQYVSPRADLEVINS